MDLHWIADSVPAAITTFATGTAAVITGVVKLAKMWRAIQDANMKSTPPTALPAPPLVPAHPFASAETTGRFLEAHTAIVMRTEWILGEKQSELDKARAEMSAVASDARRTADTLVLTERALSSANAKLATLEQTAEHWRAEAERLEREVDRLRARQRSERVDPETLKTPLRPPAKPRGA